MISTFQLLRIDSKPLRFSLQYFAEASTSEAILELTIVSTNDDWVFHVCQSLPMIVSFFRI